MNTSGAPTLIVYQGSICPIELSIAVLGHAQKDIIDQISMTISHNEIIFNIIMNRRQMATLRMNEIKIIPVYAGDKPVVLTQFIPCESRFIGVFR